MLYKTFSKTKKSTKKSLFEEQFFLYQFPILSNFPFFSFKFSLKKSLKKIFQNFFKILFENLFEKLFFISLLNFSTKFCRRNCSEGNKHFFSPLPHPISKTQLKNHYYSTKPQQNTKTQNTKHKWHTSTHNQQSELPNQSLLPLQSPQLSSQSMS